MNFQTIQCPECKQPCQVPKLEDACVFFHRCECCGVQLKPKAGDCCVICSYSEERCLPKQREGHKN